MMRIVEFIHDRDHSVKPSNLDLWAEKQKNVETRKFYCYGDRDFPSLDSFDLLVIHGGDQHLWKKDQDPWLYGEIAFVRSAIEAEKPVLGFCLGSQIIVDSCGGEVFSHDTEELGFYHITPGEKGDGHKILRGLEEGFLTFEWHSDHYSLPEHMSTLAFTKGVANQIIVSSRYPLAGFQFHPEFTVGNILDYADLAGDRPWNIEGRGGVTPGEFRSYLDSLPDREPLFERLLTNVMDYFSGEFPGSLVLS